MTDSSNNAQTKLHTMFEDMIQDLEETNRTLIVTANSLSSSQAALSATHGELATVKNKLDATTNELAAAKFSRDQNYGWYIHEYEEHKKTIRDVATLEGRIQRREGELAREKEKAKTYADSEKQLRQVKKQWSSLSNILCHDQAKG
ncbi:hypothetical protein J4E89_002598 [Alternaria sp. Ai002NY15]|nr:hypothetical protein J4E89_002598 [Alternaria sp. Ai002NY15]